MKINLRIIKIENIFKDEGLKCQFETTIHMTSQEPAVI